MVVQQQGYIETLTTSESCDDYPHLGIPESDRVGEAQIFKASLLHPIQVAATVRDPPPVHHCPFSEGHFQ